MALSDYCSFAVNERGNVCNDVFTSDLGVRCEIYKTWLYVYDEKAWDARVGNVAKPLVLTVNKGKLHYKDIYIIAELDEQGVFYVVVYTSDKNPRRAMAGIGCFGEVANAKIPHLSNLVEESFLMLDKSIGEPLKACLQRWNE